jgi:hypothetical protein
MSEPAVNEKILDQIIHALGGIDDAKGAIFAGCV